MKEIVEEEYQDADWYDHKELERFRGPASWIQKNLEVIFGIISCTMLTLAVFRIWEGMSFLFFIVFFIITIVTIIAKRQQLGKSGRA